jgi:uncharacterized protein (TIGR02145 family)
MKNSVKIFGLILFVIVIISCKKNGDKTDYDVYDSDGNGYHTVVIGAQTWMLENLKTTRYNDNTEIPLVTENTAWSNLSTPAYCWPDNNPPASEVFLGALYNWYTIEAQKLCPAGWHVPTRADYLALEEYLGGEAVAGGKMKEAGTAHWKDPNTGATNESGFTALPGAARNEDGTFFPVNGYSSVFWTASTYSESAYYLGIGYLSAYITTDVAINKKAGHLIRCIKN